MTGKPGGECDIDNLIKSCLAIKKTINTKTSLPEEREKIEVFLLDILNNYADPGLFAIWIAEAKTEKFMKENVGKTVSLTGCVNENSYWISREAFKVWKVILEKKHQYATEAKIDYGLPHNLFDKFFQNIKIILKKPAYLKGDDTVTVSGVLGVSTDLKCPWVIHSADLLKHEGDPESYDGGFEGRLNKYKRYLGEHKKKYSDIEEAIRIGKTKQGKPFSIRYLETLKRDLKVEKSGISFYTQEVKKLQGKVAIAQKYGADTVDRIEKIESLKNDIASRKQTIEGWQEQLRKGVSTKGKTKGQSYSHKTVMQLKWNIKGWEEYVKEHEEELMRLSDHQTLKAYDALHSGRKENNHLSLVRA